MMARESVTRILIAVTFFVALPSMGWSQSALHSLPGAPGFTAFGRSVSGVGDANGDGVRDYAVGGDGYVAVFSGNGGAGLGVMTGSASFGASLAGPEDVDGDGFADIAVGAPNEAFGGPGAGRVAVLSGAGGNTLWFADGVAGTHLGHALAICGDVDQDGIIDLIAGTNPDAGPGAAHIFSGATGQLLQSFSGPSGFGFSVDGAGDVNSDGLPDVIVGSDVDNQVWIFSGQSGALIDQIAGSGTFGYSVSAAGDIDLDGFDDVIVGAPTSTETFVGPGVFIYVTVTREVGRVWVHSGADSSVLREFVGYGSVNCSAPTDRLGTSVDSAGDFDLDGIPDILCGGHQIDTQPNGCTGRGVVKVFSGMSFSLQFFTDIYLSAGHTTLDAFGTAVAGLGDIDGDGTTEILAGAAQPGSAGSPGPGYAEVHRGPLGPLAFSDVIGFGCGGTSNGPWIFMSGRPLLGQPRFFSGFNVHPNLAGTLFASTIPSGPTVVAPFCNIYVDPATAFPVAPLVSDASGDFSLTLSIPNVSGLLGLRLRLQAVFFPAPGQTTIDSTNGLDIRVGL